MTPGHYRRRNKVKLCYHTHYKLKLEISTSERENSKLQCLSDHGGIVLGRPEHWPQQK